MLTPLRPETYDNLVLNAGIFLIGVDPSTMSDIEALETAMLAALDDDTKCLGATRGGGTFAVARESREVEADGARYRFVGSTIIDSQDASLATTLIELTPGNIQRVLGSATVTKAGERTAIVPRTSIQKTDYIPLLVWIGDTNSQGYLAIALKNAINTADVNFTISDKNEVTAAVEFHAAQGSVNDFDTPPYAIYRFDPAPSDGTQSSTPSVALRAPAGK